MPIQQFRQTVYQSLIKRADAFIDLLDALTVASYVSSPAALSEETPFRRKFSSVFDTLLIGEFDFDELLPALYEHQPTDSEQMAGYEVDALDTTRWWEGGETGWKQDSAEALKMPETHRIPLVGCTLCSAASTRQPAVPRRTVTYVRGRVCLNLTDGFHYGQPSHAESRRRSTACRSKYSLEGSRQIHRSCHSPQ